MGAWPASAAGGPRAAQCVPGEPAPAHVLGLARRLAAAPAAWAEEADRVCAGLASAPEQVNRVIWGFSPIRLYLSRWTPGAALPGRAAVAQHARPVWRSGSGHDRRSVRREAPGCGGCHAPFMGHPKIASVGSARMWEQASAPLLCSYASPCTCRGLPDPPGSARAGVRGRAGPAGLGAGAAAPGWRSRARARRPRTPCRCGGRAAAQLAASGRQPPGRPPQPRCARNWR